MLPALYYFFGGGVKQYLTKDISRIGYRLHTKRAADIINIHQILHVDPHSQNYPETPNFSHVREYIFFL